MITDEILDDKIERLRKSAEKRGYTLTLSRANVRKILLEPFCQYTGLPFDDERVIRSFERIDNNKGYEPGNVIPVAMHVNKMKSNHTLDFLRKQPKKMVEKQSNVRKFHENNILDMQTKIEKRKLQITELQTLLISQEAKLEEFISKRVEIQAECDRVQTDSELLEKTIAVLETNPNIGRKYMTLMQKLKKVVFGLRLRVR